MQIQHRQKREEQDKQVCVYGFKPEALKFYCEYGKKYGKAKIT